MRSLINKILQSKLSNVFAANILNKFFMFIANAIVVRMLSKEEFGLFTVANNIFAISALFAGFGLGSGILQYCSEKRPKNERTALFLYCLKAGTIASLIICLCVFIYGQSGWVTNRDTAQYITISSLLPSFYFEYFALTLFLRANKDVKVYTKLININTIIYAVASLTGAYFGKGSYVILARYVSYIISIVYGYIYTKPMIVLAERTTLQHKLIKDVWKFSLSCGVVSAINQVIYYTDIFMIDTLINDPVQVAIYKVATIIPENLAFIPSSVMVVFIPLFAENQSNREWIRRTTIRIIRTMAVANVIICVVLTIFAPVIIQLIWGQTYLGAVVPFRILIASYFFLATFRLMGTEILASQHRTKDNIVISIFTLLANVVLNKILIDKYGITGAAVATLLVVIFASLMIIPVLYRNAIKID